MRGRRTHAILTRTAAQKTENVRQRGPGELVEGVSGQSPGRDVGWAVAQGQTRPIREVLSEQKRNHNAQDKALRDAAFRERAWLQASLASCLCCYPLVKAETESEHEEWCPAHGMHLSRKAARAAEQTRTQEEKHG